jgi:2-dehydro-3-deoxygalactonokinase
MTSLIGLDWGSSNVRAFAFDASGRVTASARSSAGAMTLVSADAFNNAFENLLAELAIDNTSIPVIACGMIGARDGWVEAGYVGLNTSARSLKHATKEIRARSEYRIAVVPGMKSDEPDVMRGEETQIVGADVESGVIVLPGTHSKWVRVDNGRIVEFKSYLTGEMNALLRGSSTIGKAISTEASIADESAIVCGIDRARAQSLHWLHELFCFRARVVSGAQTAVAASNELTAWLIASEFVQASTAFEQVQTIHVIASASLLRWYERVARAFGIECIALDAEVCAARGLWRIANAT